MLTLYAKALELRMIHQAEARRHHAWLATIQTAVIVVAGLISTALLVAPDLASAVAVPDLVSGVDVVASILAALLALANAYSKFARHEPLEAAHTVTTTSTSSSSASSTPCPSTVFTSPPPRAIHAGCDAGLRRPRL